MDSKILDEDKDEWIYTSMNKYRNLYMFELEFPADTLEIIDNTTLCLTGLQPYSKKCELVQLFIPPKLLPKDKDEGLVKDRDFQIVSGGYASSRIVQVQPLPSSLVACSQVGEDCVTLYKLGNDDSAVIKEHLKLSPPSSASSSIPSTPILTSHSTKLFSISGSGPLLTWDLSSEAEPKGPQTLTLFPPGNGASKNTITKMQNWDENTLLLLSEEGVIYFQDLRLSSPPKKAFTSSFSNSNSQPSPSTFSPGLFTFSILPSKNRIGVADSAGGYEGFDMRMWETEKGKCDAAFTRTRLPLQTDSVIRDKFNLEFSPHSEDLSFLLTGFNSSSLTVFREGGGGGQEVEAVFTHEGHSKLVTRGLFHGEIEDLVFSTSVDSVLHAWQPVVQVEEGEGKKE